MSLNFRRMLFGGGYYRLSLALAAALFSGCDSGSDSTAPKNDPRVDTSSSSVSPAGQSASVSPATAGRTTVFTTANGFEGIYAIQNVTLSPGKDGLSIHAETNDPALGLPLLTVRRGTKVSVHVRLSSPGQTNAQLFYDTLDAPEFNEAHSVRTPTHQGDNDLSIEVNDPNFIGKLRLDPGELPGEYVIKLIEVIAGDRIP